MCGISAVIDRAASPGAASQLMRMHAEIRHRGPDGERFVFIDPNGAAQLVRDTGAVPSKPVIAAMAFRRLNVIDLSEAASQPMSSPDGQVWITFNGEIYNFRELRTRLAANGRVFATHGDTEVALAAYEAWGTRCFEELDGMWGIVIVDLRRRVAIASRDRFGIKPLYWSRDGERILIASEVKQLVAARDERPRAHAPIVAAFLRGNRVPVLDETFFEGITPLPAASFVEIPLDGRGALPAPQTYWDFRAIEPRELSDREYASCVDEVEARLRHAVATHNVADVNVGYLVSGGLDSSLLAAVAAKDIAPPPTFSFGFRDPRFERFSELPYAESVARKCGLTLHETTFDEAWVVANAGRVMRAMDEPVLGMAALAQFRVFELCRAHGMTVIVDGEASDEVFAGYPSYQVNLLRDQLDRRDLFGFARELRAMGRYEERSSFAIIRELLARRLAQKKPMEPWLEPSYGRDLARIEAARHALADRGQRSSRVARLLFRDVKWGNVKIILGYTDRVSMASSIEARVPFLDRALVELAFSLPDRFKAGGGQRKRVLRDVARRYLPNDVTERKDRMGFGTPDELFIRGAMWPDVEARVRSVASGTMFPPGAVARFVDGFAARAHNDVRAIWRIYALARWAEEFGVAL
jgi:asparagine synthase (glutamine-hydrolysing)